MDISVELTFIPLKDDFEPYIIDFIKRLRISGLKVIETALSTQVFGEYDKVMTVLNLEIKSALGNCENGLINMKIVTSDRYNYEPNY